jgi:hypothetical protein
MPKYSATTRAFYAFDSYPDGFVPSDAVEISDEVRVLCLAGEAAGQVIDADENGYPFLRDPDPVPLEVLKAQALARISILFKSTRTTIAGTVDETEIAGWSNKLRIAQAITAGTATIADAQAFQVEVQARGLGETVHDLGAKVLNNSALYSSIAGIIDGQKRYAAGMIDAATDAAAINQAVQNAESAAATILQG